MKHLNLRFLAAVLGISLAATALCAPKTPVCHGDTLRILAIGNSFSEDALEQEFIPLCKSAGANVIVGNLYIGGCPVERHYDNLKNNKPDYSYRKSDTSGRCDTINNDVLSRALLDEPWDIISFQQASHDSGKKRHTATFRPLSRTCAPSSVSIPVSYGIRHGPTPPTATTADSYTTAVTSM